MAIITNEDIKLMGKVNLMLEESDIKEQYSKMVERFIGTKKNIANKQNNWNKENREYHRITNNISYAKKRGNKEKEIYWRNKLEEFKKEKR